MLKRLSLAALFVLLAVSTSLAAPSFPGKVVHISDGDTITVLRDHQQIKVRLHGIDCPETGQPWGTRAKQFTANLVGMQAVQVQPRDKDRYGRLVAVVSLPGSGESLNLELVHAGLAWWYGSMRQGIGPWRRRKRRPEPPGGDFGQTLSLSRPGSGDRARERLSTSQPTPPPPTMETSGRGYSTGRDADCTSAKTGWRNLWVGRRQSEPGSDRASYAGHKRGFKLEVS